MIHATYIGEIEALKGKTALLFKYEFNENYVYVQFDEIELEYRGEKLGFGRHLFDKGDFEEQYEDNNTRSD